MKNLHTSLDQLYPTIANEHLVPFHWDHDISENLYCFKQR